MWRDVLKFYGLTSGFLKSLLCRCQFVCVRVHACMRVCMDVNNQWCDADLA